MKKSKKSGNIIFSLFIVINIIFIFIQIHKQSYLVKLYFEKQRLEKEKGELIHKKNNLAQRLHELINPKNIMDYAVNNLKMQKIKLNQTNKLILNE